MRKLWTGSHVCGVPMYAALSNNGTHLIQFILEKHKYFEPERCAVAKCRRDPSVTDRGIPLCDVHYAKLCEKQDALADALAAKYLKSTCAQANVALPVLDEEMYRVVQQQVW